MKTARLAPVGVLLLVSGGCFQGKKPSVPVPVPAPPAAAPAATKPKPITPSPTPAPVIPAPSNASPPNSETAKPSPFPPITTQPVKPKPAPAPVSAPKLGTILSADQRRQLDTAYQADIRQSNAVLDGLAGRKLNTDQTDNVNRARAFLKQAADYHDRDLTIAAELAHRAKVLTQDLAKTLK